MSYPEESDLRRAVDGLSEVSRRIERAVFTGEVSPLKLPWAPWPGRKCPFCWGRGGDDGGPGSWRCHQCDGAGVLPTGWVADRKWLVDIEQNTFDYAPPSDWPDPASIPILGSGKSRRYRTSDGEFTSVTTILKILGLGTEGLIKWSANVEHQAVIEAAVEAYASDDHDGPASFAAAIEKRLGAARQHVKINEKAKDIGSAVHAACQRVVLGQPLGDMPDPVTVAVMAFEDVWRASGLKLIRSEQPVWDPELGIAGTVDAIVEHPERGIGIIDLKSSKYVYDEYHLQVAAYCHLTRRWSDVRWAEIVRLPKSLDNLAVEVVPLGQCYDRQLTEPQLLEAFKAALTAWRILCQ